MIVGFVIDGNKSILLRAAGPALATLGVSGALADPRLTLAATATNGERANDNWAQGEGTAALFARLGAFPFPAGSMGPKVEAACDFVSRGHGFAAVGALA